MTSKQWLPVWLLFIAIAGCKPSYYLGQQTATRLTVDSATAQTDPGMAAFLQPYRQKLDQTMNEVLTRSTGRIEKGQPDAPLNDLLTDALLQQATQRYGKPVDCSHLNLGGIRTNLPAGNITIGSIYEVMPFDNQLVVMTLKGDMLQQFLNHFAAANALVIGGLRTKIKDGKVQSVQFTNGRTLQPNETYTVAMSDYIADGGENVGYIKGAIRRENLNYLIRDAFIDYFRQQGKTGTPLTPVSDGRVTVE